MSRKKSAIVYEVDAAGLSRALRDRRGDQSLSAAAADVGCSPSTLYHAERGLPPAKLEIYLRFCAWIGVTVIDFVKVNRLSRSAEARPTEA